jgi:hypothetical protein
MNMSKTILYTNDENAATGIREASFEEILDAARLALASRVRRGTGFTSPRVTADYLRVRPSTLDHEVFCVIYLTKRHQFTGKQMRSTLERGFRRLPPSTPHYLAMNHCVVPLVEPTIHRRRDPHRKDIHRRT